MFNEIIYKGLLLSTSKCRYWQVKSGNTNKLYEDPDSSTLILEFSPGSTALSLSKSLGIKLIGNPGQEITSSGSFPTKFIKTTISLNGLVLQKLTADNHTISIIRVSDSESRVVQNYRRTTFVVNQNDLSDPNFLEFLFFSGNLLFLRPLGKLPKGYTLNNFPKIVVGSKSLELESESTQTYALRKRYNDYLIREIDYTDQFILEVRHILDKYGIDFIRINKEMTLSRTSYVTYQMDQTPTPYHHPSRNNMAREIIDLRLPINFTLHTPDTVLYHDFKAKYQNVDLLTNLTMFKTSDKYGDRWTASVKWFNITEDFSQIYQADDNSNFANQCQFRCEIYFHEVKDSRYEFLKEIITELDSEDKNGEGKIIEKHDTV